MKYNKFPGSDGYTVELFKFGMPIKVIFVKGNQLYFLIKKNELSVLQRLDILHASLSVIHSDNILENVSLYTFKCIYMIISGCLARRIKSTLDILVSDAQSEILKERYIGENTIYILSWTEYHKICKDFEHLLLSFCFTK